MFLIVTLLFSLYRMNGSTTDNAKRVVDQLRRESNLPRMKLSQAAQDLVK